jgi:hypothetical protein
MTEHTPPTAGEIAALTARLRALSTAGAAADPAETARFLADKDALLARITAADPAIVDDPPMNGGIDNRRGLDNSHGLALGRDVVDGQVGNGLDNEPTGGAAGHAAGSASWSGDEWADYRTFTPDEAAAELIARGIPPDHAPEVVERYLDGLSWERGWSPQDQWQIDTDDIDVMLAAPAPIGESVDAGDQLPPFAPSDAELDRMHARVQAARAEGRFWQPAGAQMQWRQREEPSPDGRRWELHDVTDEPSALADAYGSVYGTGYDSWQRDNDPSARFGLAGADGPPVDVGPALSAEEAACELAVDGRSLNEARALVQDYLDDVSERVGTAVHRWGLDEADLNDIRAATHQPPSDRDGLDEQERRDQLNRWHATDTAETHDEDDLGHADGQECPT